MRTCRVTVVLTVSELLKGSLLRVPLAVLHYLTHVFVKQSKEIDAVSGSALVSNVAHAAARESLRVWTSRPRGGAFTPTPSN